MCFSLRHKVTYKALKNCRGLSSFIKTMKLLKPNLNTTYLCISNKRPLVKFSLQGVFYSLRYKRTCYSIKSAHKVNLRGLIGLRQTLLLFLSYYSKPYHQTQCRVCITRSPWRRVPNGLSLIRLDQNFRPLRLSNKVYRKRCVTCY